MEFELSDSILAIIIPFVLAVGASVFGYFMSIKKSLRKYKNENKKKMDSLDGKIDKINSTLDNLSKGFVHFVKRNDQIHANNETEYTPMADEIKSLLEDKHHK